MSKRQRVRAKCGASGRRRREGHNLGRERLRVRMASCVS